MLSCIKIAWSAIRSQKQFLALLFFLSTQIAEYGTFYRDLVCAKGAQVRRGCTKVAKFFSQVRKFVLFCQALYFIANNGEQLCLVYVKKIASKILITYIVVALPALRYGSSAYRK